MNPEDLSVEELQKLLAKKQEEEQEIVADDEDVSVDSNFRVQRKESGPRREAVKARKNTWSDNGEHKDIDTPDIEPTPRNRKKAHKVEKKCHVCGKVFPVHPSLISGEFWRCDRCIGR